MASSLFISVRSSCLSVCICHGFQILTLSFCWTALAMVRNISKLSPTALIADVIIFTGIAYIFGTEISVIAKNGVADVQLFNRNDFSLLLG